MAKRSPLVRRHHSREALKKYRQKATEQAQKNRETMRVTHGLAVTAGIFNGVGLSLAIGSFIVTDHITKGDPLHWPSYKAMSVPILAGILTPLLLGHRRHRIWKWKYWRAHV